MSTKRRWLLPEAIEDLLPAEARQVENLRRRMLDEFTRHGYEFVMPPLLEYVDSLLTGTGHDLDLRTCKLVDQLSGRTVGIRADITPQVARIDAHLLNRRGVTRLCYCGSVLHALPAGLFASREPIQIGAELYGHAGIEADTEIVRLLGRALALGDIRAARIDLGHVGIFRALADQAGLTTEAREELFSVLQAKDVPELRNLVAGVAEPLRSAFLALPECYGGAEALALATRSLPDLPQIRAALADLRRLAETLGDLPLGFDLADLRGYHYHSGVVIAAYSEGSPSALAFGGRYDQIGSSFGRGRPATGFSLDLRAVARLSMPSAPSRAILAPWPQDNALRGEADRLRAAGDTVIFELPEHAGSWREAGCDRVLVRRDDAWTIEPLKED